MKLHSITKITYVCLLSTALMSCEKFLDREPPSQIVPSDYYRSEDQIQAAVNQFYTELLPSHGGGYGLFGVDIDTDNQADMSADPKFSAGQWRVGMDNDNWSWSTIRNINYQLNTILGRYENGEINGNDRNIRHYIGELYFLRAFAYFDMLQLWGDLPIL